MSKHDNWGEGEGEGELGTGQFPSKKPTWPNKIQFGRTLCPSRITTNERIKSASTSKYILRSVQLHSKLNPQSSFLIKYSGTPLTRTPEMCPHIILSSYRETY